MGYDQFVSRLVTILAILFAAFPGVGVGLADGQAPDRNHDCGSSGCHEVIFESTCCGELTEVSVCPKSGGPCTCAAVPMPDRQPRPDAPLPRTDRDSITGLPSGSPQITAVIDEDIATHEMASLVVSPRSGKTHNEVQALLGIWRT